MITASYDLEFSDLHAFVVLAGELHFRKASERLFLSQPALSKKIQRLEEKLKGALFVRSRRRVALTDAGKSFLPKATKLLQDAEDALRETEAVVAGRTGTLRIGFGIASLPEILPRTILRFRKLYPDVELQMREMPSPAQVSSLIEGGLDAGILRMPLTDRKLQCVPLFSEHLVLATPSDLPFRRKSAMKDLRDSGFIFVSREVLQDFSRSRAQPLSSHTVHSTSGSGSERNLDHSPLGTRWPGSLFGPEVSPATQSAGSAVSRIGLERAIVAHRDRVESELGETRVDLACSQSCTGRCRRAGGVTRSTLMYLGCFWLLFVQVFLRNIILGHFVGVHFPLLFVIAFFNSCHGTSLSDVPFFN